MNGGGAEMVNNENYYSECWDRAGERMEEHMAKRSEDSKPLEKKLKETPKEEKPWIHEHPIQAAIIGISAAGVAAGLGYLVYSIYQMYQG